MLGTHIVPSIAVGVNRSHRGKLPPGASVDVWREYNRHFVTETLTPDELVNTIWQGHAVSAVCAGYRKSENFVSRQELSLDFDQGDRTLDELARDPFLVRHAYALHTTSSHTPQAPRLRAVFILDRPITDPDQYARYARALVWRFQTSDIKCKDAVRLWFGAFGCEVRTLGNVLAVAVLDELAATLDDVEAQRAAVAVKMLPMLEAEAKERMLAGVKVDPTQKVGEGSGEAREQATAALDAAIGAGTVGNRNAAGFDLACALRDAGLTSAEAWPFMADYVLAVGKTGNHPYTDEEAAASLKSAYSKPPRLKTHQATVTLPDGRTAHVDTVLDALEQLAVTHVLPFNPGARHDQLKTFMGIIRLMRDSGRIEDVALPGRTLQDVSGVPWRTAYRHLTHFVATGLLTLTQKSDYVRANLYTVNLERITNLDNTGHGDTYQCNGSPETPPALVCVTVSPNSTVGHVATYHALQTEDACRPGARLHTLSPKYDGTLSHVVFGPAVQQLLSVLASHDVQSLAHLDRLSHVGARTRRRKWRLLQAHGIVTSELDPDDERRHVPALTSDWYERLVQLAPHLETFAHGLLRADHTAGQRITHHERMLRYVHGDDKEIAERAVFNAHELRRRVRPELERAFGIRSELRMPGPELRSWTLAQRAADEERKRQPVGAHGRTIIPGRVKVGKNAKLLAELPEYEPPRTPAVGFWHAVSEPDWLRDQLLRNSGHVDGLTANAAKRALNILDNGAGDRKTLNSSLHLLGLLFRAGQPSVEWSSL